MPRPAFLIKADLNQKSRTGNTPAVVHHHACGIVETMGVQAFKYIT